MSNQGNILNVCSYLKCKRVKPTFFHSPFHLASHTFKFMYIYIYQHVYMYIVMYVCVQIWVSRCSLAYLSYVCMWERFACIANWKMHTRSSFQTLFPGGFSPTPFPLFVVPFVCIIMLLQKRCVLLVQQSFQCNNQQVPPMRVCVCLDVCVRVSCNSVKVHLCKYAFRRKLFSLFFFSILSLCFAFCCVTTAYLSP